MKRAAVVAVLLPAGLVACTGDTGGAPVASPQADRIPSAAPSPAPSPAPPLLDGTTYALLVAAAGGGELTFDEVEPSGSPECDAANESLAYQEVFRACWTNPDPRLRTLDVLPSAVIVEQPESGPPRELDWAELQALLQSERTDAYFRHAPWEMTVEGGAVVELRQGLRPTGA